MLYGFRENDLRQVKCYMVFAKTDLPQVKSHMALVKTDLRQVKCYMAFENRPATRQMLYGSLAN